MTFEKPTSKDNKNDKLISTYNSKSNRGEPDGYSNSTA